MLDEARKREKVANAFLLATLAASAAQSPRDFVRTGHVESPGTALMQMWGKKRGEAERNLDHGRVSHPARNRKKKTVGESKEHTMKEVETKLPKGHKLKNERKGKGDHVFFDVVDDKGNAIQTPVPVGGAKKGKNKFSSSLKGTATNAGNFIKKVHQAIDDVQSEKDAAPTTAKRMSAAYKKRMSEIPAKEKYKKASSIMRQMKRKTFREFVEEAYLLEQSREEAEKKRLAKDNPDEWRVRKVGRRGEEKWTTKRKDSISGQGKRRRQRLKGMTYQEILAFTKRNLKPKPSELAKAAQKIESGEKAAQTREATKKTQETGTKHVVDHNQPQQDKRRPGNRERFERVVPGDVSSNRSVLPEPENLSKGSKPPKKGEPGYGTTRSGAIKKVVDKAEKESNK